MKARLSTTLAGVLFLAGTATAQTIIVTPEQETVIREYVVTQQVQPIEIPAEFTLEVGATFPETITLQPLDVPELDVEYRYVVVDGRTVLVEPETRRIVHIIEQ